MGDVFDQLLAKIFEDHAAATAEAIAHTAQNADLAAPDQSVELSGLNRLRAPGPHPSKRG
jgi:hypothetical protein